MNTANTKADAPTALSRVAMLSLPSATLLVVANMVGSGVFTTSGFALEALGQRPLVLAAWVVAGLIALLGVHAYATLAALFPGDGGEVHYVTQTLHPRVGAALGWLSLWAGFAGPIAACGLTLEAYVSAYVPMSLPAGTVAAAFVIILAAPQVLRVPIGVWVQNVSVVLLVALLVSGIVLGAGALPPVTTYADAEQAPSWVAFFTSVAWISFAYSGWNATTYVSGRVTDAPRNVPRALFAGTLLVTVIYLAINSVILYAGPPEALAGKAEVAVVAAQSLWGDAASTLLTLTVSVALASSITSMLMAGSGVVRRMLQNGQLPGAPRIDLDGPLPVVGQAALALLLIFVADLREVLSLLAFLLGVGTTTTVLGLLVYLRKQGKTRRPMWGYPVLPLTFVAATASTTLAVAWRFPWLVVLATAGFFVSFAIVAVVARRDQPAINT